MAAPQLKTTVPTSSPRRVLLNTGAVPKSQPKLKSASGQTIQAKKTTLIASSATESAKPTKEPTATSQQAETEAQVKAAQEAAAAAAAEAERLAKEEYDRQMAEYHRQMEEYNRQKEEYEKALRNTTTEATTKPVVATTKTKAAPTPQTQATPLKRTAVKSGVKVTPAAPQKTKITHKPAGATKITPSHPSPQDAAEHETNTTSEPTEASGTATPKQKKQRTIGEAEFAQLQKLAESPPVWKRVPFWVGVGALVALAVSCTIYAVNVNAAAKARKAEIDACNQILMKAQQINKNRVETLADARKKGVDITCSEKDAAKLLSIVVNPTVKDDTGKPAYGGDPDGVAQLSCLLLGIASEADPKIDKLIFDTLNTHAKEIKPSHYRWLIQRMAISDNKGINKKFRTLAEKVSKQEKWNKKGEILSYIWEAMGLRVTKKDIPDIIKLLKDDALDTQLAGTLAICLSNILEMTDNMAEKQKIGDEIFTNLPKKYRTNGRIMGALGRACSPAALEFFKKRAEDTKNWRNDQDFFANYYSDDIIPYLQELKAKVGGDAKLTKAIETNIRSIVAQNRERTPEEAQKLLALVFDKLDEDTSAWDEIINKTDPDAASFVGKDSPEYPQLMERRKNLEECRKQKTMLINTLAGMHNHAWVVNLLDRFSNDPDSDIAHSAKQARENVDRNTAESAALRAKYNSRDKN